MDRQTDRGMDGWMDLSYIYRQMKGASHAASREIKLWTWVFVIHSALVNRRSLHSFLAFRMSTATWAGSALCPLLSPSENRAVRYSLPSVKILHCFLACSGSILFVEAEHQQCPLEVFLNPWNL